MPRPLPATQALAMANLSSTCGAMSAKFIATEWSMLGAPNRASFMMVARKIRRNLRHLGFEIVPVKPRKRGAKKGGG